MRPNLTMDPDLQVAEDRLLNLLVGQLSPALAMSQLLVLRAEEVESLRSELAEAAVRAALTQLLLLPLPSKIQIMETLS